MYQLRFSLWWLMIVVAIAGAMLWGERMRRISLGHRKTAERFADVAKNPILPCGSIFTTPEEDAALQAKRKRIVEYYSAMRAKYERAARYPWLPVAPDPPKPKGSYSGLLSRPGSL